jgi:SSS family solute:Na+ symporter
LRISQALTFVLGGLALILAMAVTNVLDLMLMSYAFMVSGLLVPLIGGLVFNVRRPAAAIASMVLGGSITVLLIAFRIAPQAEALTRDRIAALEDRFPEVMERIQEGSPTPSALSRAVEDAQLLRSEHLDLAFQLPWALDPNVFGIMGSLLVFLILGRTARKS